MRRGCAAAAALSLLLSLATAVEVPQRGTDQIAHLCMVAFGSLERWQQVRDVRYTQVTTRYLSGNRPASEAKAEVYLRYQPRRQCRIESLTRDGSRQVTIFDGEKIRVEIAGREDASPGTRRRALRSALNTLYLFAMPFSARDPGVTLIYRGKTKASGREMYVLQAAVRPGGGSSPPDTYDYYVDTETFRIPQLVYTIAEDRVTYIVRWEDYRNLDGLLRAARWEYMASEKQKAMTVEFQDLKLNSGLVDSLFRIPPAGGPAARHPSTRPAASPAAAP